MSLVYKMFSNNLRSKFSLSVNGHPQTGGLLVTKADNLTSVRYHSDDSLTQSKKKAKTPAGKLDDKIESESQEVVHPNQEKEPLERFPNNTNPKTGEIGGPRGPEPTRYGDWERKGRVTDF